MKINIRWCQKARSLSTKITAEAFQFHLVCKFKNEILECKCLLPPVNSFPPFKLLFITSIKIKLYISDIISWWLAIANSFPRFEKLSLSSMWCFSSGIDYVQNWKKVSFIAIKRRKMLSKSNFYIFISGLFFEVTVIYSFQIRKQGFVGYFRTFFYFEEKFVKPFSLFVFPLF